MDLPNRELAPATGGWRLGNRNWGTEAGRQSLGSEAGGWRLGNRGWGTEAGYRGWDQRLEYGGWGTEAKDGSCGHTHVYSPLAHCPKMVFPLLLTPPS